MNFKHKFKKIHAGNLKILKPKTINRHIATSFFNQEYGGCHVQRWNAMKRYINSIAIKIYWTVGLEISICDPSTFNQTWLIRVSLGARELKNWKNKSSLILLEFCRMKFKNFLWERVLIIYHSAGETFFCIVLWIQSLVREII